MPTLWRQTQNGNWVECAIAGTLLNLAPPHNVLLARAPSANVETWFLLAAPQAGVRVNGVASHLGLQAIHDRDEINAGGQRIFFSIEQTPVIELYSGPAGGTCPRCTRPLAPNETTIRCPRCGAWHHHQTSGDFPCWTYAEHCAAGCGQSTALDTAGERWTPESL